MAVNGKSQRAPSYKSSGVNIDAGEEAVKAIKNHVKRTYGPRVIPMENGFAGLISLEYAGNLFKQNLKSPVMGACTDGVGTKLKIAIAMDIHDTVGIDLVAMSVNDLITLGIEPLIFLDYIGTNSVDPAIIERIVAGVAEGCHQAGASLIGGEIAELGDMYKPGEYDLVGFASGVAERAKLITGKAIVPGDVIIALPSSGIHSNGYSLARKVLKTEKRSSLNRNVAQLGKTVGEALLTPTRIYVKPVMHLLSRYKVKKVVHGIVHITGGGIYGNVPRILPANCKAVIQKNSWRIPPIFDLIRREGRIDKEEMFHVFNMGIGLVLIVSPFYADSVIRRLKKLGENPGIIGKIARGAQQVEII